MSIYQFEASTNLTLIYVNCIIQLYKHNILSSLIFAWNVKLFLFCLWSAELGTLKDNIENLSQMLPSDIW